MKPVLDESLIYEILSVVGEIPHGRVASYGQIARLIGRERNSRLVGRVLSMAERYGDYPCHRVVNHAAASRRISTSRSRASEKRASAFSRTATST